MDLPSNIAKWLEDNGAEFHAGYHRELDPLTGLSKPGVMQARIIDKRTGMTWAEAKGEDKLHAIKNAVLIAETKARPIRDGGISTDTNELRDEVAELRARLKKYETPEEPKPSQVKKSTKPKKGTKVFDDEDPNQDPGGPEGLTKEQAAALLAD